MMVLVGAVALAAYSPWLVRAFVYERTAFPPLTQPWFGAKPDAERAAMRGFMAQAHRPGSPFASSYWRNAWGRVPVAGALLLAAAAFAVGAPGGDGRRRGLGIFVLLGYLGWNLRLDSADRFLSPLLPAMAALAALLVHDAARRVRFGVLAALPFAAWIALLLYTQTSYAVQRDWLAAGLGTATREEFLKEQLGGPTARFFEAIDKAAERTPNARVLLLYEARAGALRARTVSNTVFDPCPLWMLLREPAGDDPEAAVRALRRQGITHVAVNEVELARLIDFYPPPASRRDAAYRAVAAGKNYSGFNAGFLAFRGYYAPFYWFGGGRPDAIETRLDRFLERVRGGVIWEEDVGGARLWVAALAP